MSNNHQPNTSVSTPANAQEQPLTHEELPSQRQAGQDLVLRHFTIPAWVLRGKGPRIDIEDDDIIEEKGSTT